MRELDKDTLIMPHTHPWAQLAISTGGVIKLSLANATYIVPPHRAVWVPPGVQHAVTMVETACLYTLYFLPQAHGGGAQARWMDEAAMAGVPRDGSLPAAAGAGGGNGYWQRPCRATVACPANA